MRIIRGLSVFVFLIVTITGCGVDVRRNADGTLRVETIIQEVTIQNAINAILIDTEVRNLTMDLRQGYIQVNGNYVDLGVTQPLSFELNLSAVKGNLKAEISSALINNRPVEDERVQVWNEAIAARLIDSKVYRPASALETVVITPEKINMIWRVQTSESTN